MLTFATLRRGSAGAMTFAALVICLFDSRPAAAQVLEGETVPGDVGVAFTLNGLPNVNARPDCEELGLPCTGSGKTVAGGGWAVVGSRNFTEHVGVTGEVGLFHNLWDSAQSIHTSHREDNVVHFVMIGPRVSSAFQSSGGRSRSEARFFGQCLIGLAGGDVVIGGRALQPGAGLDVRLPSSVIIRIQLDYTFVPSSGRSISGSRALFALVFGVGSRL